MNKSFKRYSFILANLVFLIFFVVFANDKNINYSKPFDKKTTDVKPTEEPKPEVKGTEDSDSFYTVSKIIDGDTIALESGEKVRYIGVNAPEISSKDCFSQEAKNANQKILEGKKVELEKDKSETDKYGRLLRYVWVYEEGNKIMVNEYLVKGGFAEAKSYKPDIKYQQIFTQSQESAKTAKLGLWEKCKI